MLHYAQKQYLDIWQNAILQINFLILVHCIVVTYFSKVYEIKTVETDQVLNMQLVLSAFFKA